MGWVGMHPIDLAKYSDPWCVASSLNYDLWSNIFVALNVVYHL